jgi:DNA recombination protein RmuC
LPGGRTVAIDAKAVLDAYLDAVAATDEDQKQEHLKRHAAQVASRVRELASKRYWDHLDQTPEFVVLFLPAESFFSAAVDTDPALIETAVQSRVVLASPTTLIALLKAIAFGWQQQQVAENAEAISQLGRDLYDRMGTLADHLATVGTRLGSAVDSYNKAVGSLERRVLPSARKFKELGAGGSKEIASLESVDHVPRQPSLPETAEEDTGVDSDEGS